jgi:hypothetical protein
MICSLAALELCLMMLRQSSGHAKVATLRLGALRSLAIAQLATDRPSIREDTTKFCQAELHVSTLIALAVCILMTSRAR